MVSGMRLAGKCRGTGGFAALRRIVRGRIGARAGTTTVELALVGPLLIFLLFGIIEFGLIIKDVVGVNQTAREGARCAAVGSPPSAITARIATAAPAMNTANLATAYSVPAFQFQLRHLDRLDDARNQRHCERCEDRRSDTGELDLPASAGHRRSVLGAGG